VANGKWQILFKIGKSNRACGNSYDRFLEHAKDPAYPDFTIFRLDPCSNETSAESMMKKVAVKQKIPHTLWDKKDEIYSMDRMQYYDMHDHLEEYSKLDSSRDEMLRLRMKNDQLTATVEESKGENEELKIENEELKIENEELKIKVTASEVKLKAVEDGKNLEIEIVKAEMEEKIALLQSQLKALSKRKK